MSPAAVFCAYAGCEDDPDYWVAGSISALPNGTLKVNSTYSCSFHLSTVVQMRLDVSDRAVVRRYEPRS